MEGESSWVVNGIITIALIVFVVPAAARFVDELPALVLWMVIMYIVFTSISGEAIDPPPIKKK